MLPLKNRLGKKKDILRVQKYGQAYFSGKVTLKTLKNNLNQVRIGFIVGMQFSKKAVERNAMKRKLRELFRTEIPKIKEKADIVISIRKRQREKIKKEELREDAQTVLKKACLLTKSTTRKNY